ncbi:MAG: carbohydrate ABC transporter permease, partial [Acidimicrobiia bacterium]
REGSMTRLAVTLAGIVIAIGLSGLVFIGINRLFDLTENRYRIFTTAVGAITTAILFWILWANQMIVSPVAVTAIATAIGAAVGFGLGTAKAATSRLAIGVGGGLALGLLLGGSARSSTWPAIDPVATLIGVAMGAGIGVLLWVAAGRRRGIASPLLLGLSIGWLFGAWLAAGPNGSQAETIVVAAVLGALVGASLGLRPYPDALDRANIAIGSRKYIFLGPAVFFVTATLVIPLLRTIWLGFQTGNPRELEFAGLQNYIDIFTDPGILDASGWTDIFGSRVTWAALVLVVLGVGLSLWLGRSSGTGLGTGFSLSAGSITLLAGGVMLLGFSVFVAIRGTIPNNLWWIWAVIIFSVALGLAVAVLADRSKGENLAKAMIFLPMAISFVGASIIWRLMYVARPPQNTQTGVFNAIWVRVGELSNSSTASTLISLALFLLVVALFYLAWRGWKADKNAIVAGSLAVTIPLFWLIYRFMGPGLGGYRVDELTGEVVAFPVLFVQESPWNNFWLMVVLIWIQTGFAMVIFSAAIKAVPEELIEAARIDGATESQTFWRITIPQILPTIGVVVTTLIVTVLKVFDIPKVMTNGNFDTQVLANEMWERAFTQLNFGLGSAVAVVLFLGVLPVMYINIRRMQRERIG